jgi:hypothetical protein
LEALDAVYRDLDRELERIGAACDACGRCCHLASYGHELWLTDLELAFLVRRCGVRRPTEPGVCPYLEGDRCGARGGRALSCRIFHCQLDRRVLERLHEVYLERVRGLRAGDGVEIGYGELLASLEIVEVSQAGINPRTNR